jgi:hypothetical protein
VVLSRQLAQRGGGGRCDCQNEEKRAQRAAHSRGPGLLWRPGNLAFSGVATRELGWGLRLQILHSSPILSASTRELRAGAPLLVVACGAGFDRQQRARCKQPGPPAFLHLETRPGMCQGA